MSDQLLFADLVISKSEPDLGILEEGTTLFARLDTLSLEQKIETLNHLRLLLKQHSPFASEPVDCVQWIAADRVQANDYNPNSVAPPEMKLLEHSILEDGYTQPIVAWTIENQF